MSGGPFREGREMIFLLLVSYRSICWWLAVATALAPPNYCSMGEAD